jgi:uncharacterized protein (TIGR03086 family)
MDPIKAHEKSIDELTKVVEKLSLKDLEADTKCAGWNVRDVLKHLIVGNSRAALVEPSTDINDDNILEELNKVKAAALRQFNSPGALDRTYTVGIGEIPGQFYIYMRSTDNLVHAWDIAYACKFPIQFDNELVNFLFDFLQTNLKPELRGDFFAPPAPCPPESSLVDRFIAFTGRPVG